MKKKSIVLKPACENDCRDIWIWRNHPSVRKRFFNTKRVLWQDHKRWYSDKLKSKNTKIYIANINKDKVGVIRFDKEKAYIRVSINLNPDFLGKGLGCRIIKSGTRRALKDMNRRPIIAEIKKDNIASIKAFFRAGYRCSKEAKEKFIYKKKD